MGRVQNIITGARYILADESEKRYTNDMLVKYLNDGLRDFVGQTKCLKERLFVELNEVAATYDLSPFIVEFQRIQYRSKQIPIVSFSDLDKRNSDWQNETGDEVKAVTFEGMKKGFLRIYPRVTEPTNSAITQNSLYGGLIDITINDDNYQIPSFKDADSNINHYLVVYAVKKPNAVTLATGDSDLELDSDTDLALENYIAFKALRSDIDAENRQASGEQWQVYMNFVNEYKLAVSNNYDTASERVIEYRGAFR